MKKIRRSPRRLQNARSAHEALLLIFRHSEIGRILQGSHGYYKRIIEHGQTVLNERNGGKWWRNLGLLLTKEEQYKHFMEHACAQGKPFWCELVCKLRNDARFKAEFLSRDPKLEDWSLQFWEGLCEQHGTYTTRLAPTSTPAGKQGDRD